MVFNLFALFGRILSLSWKPTLMLCPICLAQIKKFTKIAKGGYSCPECKESVPGIYIINYSAYPPAILGSVGFRGHGKSVYLASLFHTLAHPELPRQWKGFYVTASGDPSLDILDEDIKMLKEGNLPDGTLLTFPKPTMIQVTGIPTGKGASLLCYDAAGESFERAGRLIKYASFFARSTTVLFLLSIPGIEREDTDVDLVAQKMNRLLTVYRNGIADLAGDTRHQRLVVVYTKADEWKALLLPQYQALRDYLQAGTFNGLDDFSSYKKSLAAISGQLRTLTLEHLHAKSFLSQAEDHFASVRFCVVSALGSSPKGQQLQTAITPRRVLDPLLWVLDTDTDSAGTQHKWWSWSKRENV